MKSSIFVYPYKKVFERTQRALKRLGLKVIKSDSESGSITAESNFSFNHRSMAVDLIIEDMENDNTRVTVRYFKLKKRFFQKDQDSQQHEADLLERLSLII